MAELTVDMTYGTALYEAAVDGNKTDLILEEAEAVLDIINNEPELKAFINYPAISATVKKDSLKEIFDGRISEELLNFLYILIDKRRMNRYEGIIKVYRSLVEHEEGYAYGEVFSVVPLDEKKIAELEEQTSKLLNINVRLTNKIDPKLIAGVKILVEGKIIDASFRKKFDEIASQISTN